MKLYLIVNQKSRVTGGQATPGTIDDPRYVEVSEAEYNEYDSRQPYEYFTYHPGQSPRFIKHPDPREVVTIQAPLQGVVGAPIAITFTLPGPENKEALFEYSRPNGNAGLVKAVFVDGVASVAFTPPESGYYRFWGSDTWRPEQEVAIAVYEE